VQIYDCIVVLYCIVNIARTTVPLSDKITNFRVTLDSCLNLHDHISTVCRSAHFHIRALCHIRGVLTDDMAKTVAASLVQSRLYYANSVLHGSNNIKMLWTVQNSLARIELPSNRHLSSNIFWQELHWLPIHSRITFQLASIRPTYKALSTNHPIYLRSLLDQYAPIQTLRSTDQHLLDRPRVNTDFGKKVFSYKAPNIWNFLPLSVKHCTSHSTFKHHLKTYLP